MITYLYFDCGALCHWSSNVSLQEYWAYDASIIGGRGHARRHESVWIVPGLAV